MCTMSVSLITIGTRLRSQTKMVSPEDFLLLLGKEPSPIVFKTNFDNRVLYDYTTVSGQNIKVDSDEEITFPDNCTVIKTE